MIGALQRLIQNRVGGDHVLDKSFLAVFALGGGGKYFMILEVLLYKSGAWCSTLAAALQFFKTAGLRAL